MFRLDIRFENLNHTALKIYHEAKYTMPKISKLNQNALKIYHEVYNAEN